LETEKVLTSTEDAHVEIMSIFERHAAAELGRHAFEL
jgi:hypothetical protein